MEQNFGLVPRKPRPWPPGWRRLYKKTGALLVIASGVLCASASAELSLKEALQLAVAGHPSIQARNQELEGAAQRLRAAEWGRYPNVTLQTTAGQPATGSVYAMRLDQPLWAGGRIDADIRSARARVIASEAAKTEAEQAILIRTASAYAEMIRLDLRIKAAEESRQEHERLLELIQRRAGNQINPESDIVMARARLEQARSEIIQLRNLAANARADLEQIIERPVNKLRIPSPDQLPVRTLQESLDAALAHAPELKRLGSEIQIAETEIEIREAARLPQLSARVERFVGGAQAYSTTYLALTLQTGAGLSAQAAVKEAFARRDATESSRQVARKDLTDRVRNDWNKYTSALNEARVLEELVTATQAMYESFVRQYPVGRKSWLEVLNARREATQARNALADARWSGFLAGMRLEILAGHVTGANDERTRSR